MIYGYRTVFDLGGMLSPLTQADGAQARRIGDGQQQSDKVAPVQGTTTVENKAADTTRPLVQPHKTEALTQDEVASRTRSEYQQGSDTPDRDLEGADRGPEPSLPQLSAEALATALMTAEPDKALVPRVLPAGSNEND